jgi:hypothetical protein
VASIIQPVKLSRCSEQLAGLSSEDLLNHSHSTNVSHFVFPHGTSNPSHFHALYLNSETKNPLHILLLPLFVVKDASPMSAFCEKEKIMKIG